MGLKKKSEEVDRDSMSNQPNREARHSAWHSSSWRWVIVKVCDIGSKKPCLVSPENSPRKNNNGVFVGDTTMRFLSMNLSMNLYSSFELSKENP